MAGVRAMVAVYVSLGSNIEREHNIRRAVQSLRRAFGGLTLSSVYDNAAVGFEGEDFLNLAAGFGTMMSPEDVVRTLRDIEAGLGRDRRLPRFSPRTIDIDLLLYGDLILDTPALRLPREEIRRYGFVLGPLAEIAGDMQDPVSGRRYGDLWREFSASGQALTPVRFDWD